MKEIATVDYDLRSIFEWIIGGVAFLGSIISAAIGSGKLLQRLEYVSQTASDQQDKLDKLEDTLKDVFIQLRHQNELLAKILAQNVYEFKN